jgi:hypothetical protein
MKQEKNQEKINLTQCWYFSGAWHQQDEIGAFPIVSPHITIMAVIHGQKCICRSFGSRKELTKPHSRPESAVFRRQTYTWGVSLADKLRNNPNCMWTWLQSYLLLILPPTASTKCPRTVIPICALDNRPADLGPDCGACSDPWPGSSHSQLCCSSSLVCQGLLKDKSMCS